MHYGAACWACNSLKIIGYKRSRFFETVAGITPGGRDNRSGKGTLLHRSIVDGGSQRVGEAVILDMLFFNLLQA